MLEEKLKAGIIVRDTNHGFPQDSLVSEITHLIKDHNLDILLGPEWLFVPKERLYTKEEKENLIGSLIESSKGTDILIIPGSIMWHDEKFCYNAAPVISNGKLLGEYHKRQNGGTTDRAEERSCKKPRFEGKEFGIYPWNGLSIGIEICADKGELKRHLMKEKTEPLLDLYFLVSCGCSLSKYDLPPVKESGYALCAEGSGPVSEVFQKMDYKTYALRLEAEERRERFLDVYHLPIEKEVKGLLASSLS